jgi:hypothetical protein
LISKGTENGVWCNNKKYFQEDECQLIEKLKEYEYTQNKIISSIKENINSINEILTLVYSADSDIPNIPHNPDFQLSRIYWNYVGDKKIIFFIIMV